MTTYAMNDEGVSWNSSISWAAVLCGALAAISCEIVLALLGVGLGLVTLQPSTGGEAQALGIGAVAWWFVSGLVSLYLGGWVAGRGLGASANGRGVLHGFLAWCLVTVASALMISSTLGALIGGGFSTLNGYISRNAAGAEMMMDGIEDRMEGRRGAGGEIQLSPEEKRRAEEAAKATGSAAFLVFGALVLGALASSFGGSKGANGYAQRKSGEHRQPAHAAAGTRR